jgi:predicted GIY-YIG superfamily endonuclease
MYYVYHLRSLSDSSRRYTGFTEDLKQRLADHNAGKNTSTAPFRPWKLIAYHAFDEKARALEFERYLKSGSGHAFASRHLW